jgi:hypothetical protein
MSGATGRRKKSRSAITSPGSFANVQQLIAHFGCSRICSCPCILLAAEIPIKTGLSGLEHLRYKQGVHF